MTDGVTHRGNISQHVQAIPSSGIRRFFDLLASMEGVISLGVGQPDFVTPNHIRQAAIKSIEDGETYYTSNYGLVELRAGISRHLHRLYGIRYDAGTEIIATAGVSEALNLALEAILDPGDEVLSPDPGYVAYLPAVRRRLSPPPRGSGAAHHSTDEGHPVRLSREPYGSRHAA
jgi:aminotransferase